MTEQAEMEHKDNNGGEKSNIGINWKRNTTTQRGEREQEWQKKEGDKEEKKKQMKEKGNLEERQEEREKEKREGTEIVREKKSIKCAVPRATPINSARPGHADDDDDDDDEADKHCEIKFPD